MNELEQLTKKFILVGMNDAKISTKDKPIIGTDSLATCIGVLLYNEEKKIAIVAHVAPGKIDAIDELFDIIIKNKLWNTNFKYLIIPGYYEEHYNTKEMIEKHLTHFLPFDKNEIPNYGIRKNEKLPSYEFAFDASTGTFVTDKVLYGTNYHMINQEEYLDKASTDIHR